MSHNLTQPRTSFGERFPALRGLFVLLAYAFAPFVGLLWLLRKLGGAYDGYPDREDIASEVVDFYFPGDEIIVFTGTSFVALAVGYAVGVYYAINAIAHMVG